MLATELRAGVDRHEMAAKVWDAARNGGYAPTVETSSLGSPVHKAPIIVFILVAAADGDIDKKEIATLQKVLAGASELGGPLGQVIREVPIQIEQLLESIGSSEQNPIAQLQEALGVARTMVDEANYFAFRIWLLNLATQVAKSSGGGFLGFGKKIDKKEQQVLAALALTLDLVPGAAAE